MTSSIHIQDLTSRRRLGVVVDRSVGGSSIGEGEVEVMVYRVGGVDDGKGAGEVCNREGLEVYSGRCFVVAGSIQAAKGIGKGFLGEMDFEWGFAGWSSF